MKFIDAAFEELVKEDGLMVFAKGLGLDQLLYRFVKLHVDGTRLTLLLNISDQQVTTFNAWLERIMSVS
jgi:DNA excision repair protein ERCC-4